MCKKPLEIIIKFYVTQKFITKWNERNNEQFF